MLKLRMRRRFAAMLRGGESGGAGLSVSINCHHNGSVNSKRTHTPKSIFQVLRSPLALDI